MATSGWLARVVVSVMSMTVPATAVAAAFRGDLVGALPVAAILTPSDGASGTLFPWSVAASGTTVVAGGVPSDDGGLTPTAGAAYVFRRPVNGWSDTAQAARLASSHGAVPGANFGDDVAVSGGTVAVGELDIGGTGPSGSVYVFAEPASGWAGRLTESAVLSPSDGATLIGPVAVSGSDVFASGASPGPAPVSNSAMYVFAEPAGGWAGTVRQVAKLVGRSGSGLAGTAVVSGRTVFAGISPVYAFDEPAGGWRGTIRPSAELVTPGRAPANNAFSLGASGRTVVLGDAEQPIPATSSMGAVYVFSEPRGGWAGTIKPAAKLTAIGFTAVLDGGEGLGATVGVSGDRVFATSAVNGFDHGCPCEESVYAFSEPPGGWSGTLAVSPAGSVQTSPNLATALAGADLFLGTTAQGQTETSAGVVSLVRPVASPSVSRVSIDGLAHGRPQLRLRVHSGGNAAGVRSFTVDLPRGLGFVQNRRQLQRDISVTDARAHSLRIDHGHLVVTLTRPAATISFQVRTPALLESAHLRKLLSGRRANRAPIMTTSIRITDATGNTTLASQTTS